MGNIFTRKTFSYKGFIHPIAKSYFDKIEAAGGIVSSKNPVNNFVTQLSRVVDPSLWVCWPLRSTQNIGTGTTAFSLGGLGNFDGTLTNSPTWSTNGLISTTAASQASIQITNFPLADRIYMFTVLRSDRSGETSGVPMQIGVSSNGPGISLQANITNRTRFNGPNLAYDGVTGSFYTLSAQLTSGAQSFYSNGQLVPGGTSTTAWTMPTNGTLTLAAGATTGTGSSTNAFCFYSLVYPPNESVIYQIYKQTLGQGLGLL